MTSANSNDLCPEHSELAAVVLGTADADRLESVWSHVDDCHACQQTVESISPDNDQLFESLKRQLPNEQFHREPDCESAVSDAESLSGQIASSKSSHQSRPADRPLDIKQVGPYQILEKLGEGGMGVVYKALHSRLDRVVAIKVLNSRRLAEAGALERFDREMKAIGKLDHPNIVRATDADEDDGVHYLVMEYVDGIDISKIVRRHGPLPIAEACEVIRQAALGLQYAHEHNMVHRDIKPSNLMLCRETRAESQEASDGMAPRRLSTLDSRLLTRVKILDLGLALLDLEERETAKGTITSSGQIMGTIDYMAPEQLADTHNVDIRADVYSLGATLFKLLTGRGPFGGTEHRSDFEKIAAIARDAPPLVSEVRGNVPTELVKVVNRMLSRDPAQRLATPLEVAEALQPWAANADLEKLVRERATESRNQTLVGWSDTKPAERPATKSRFLAWTAGPLALLVIGAIVFGPRFMVGKSAPVVPNLPQENELNSSSDESKADSPATSNGSNNDTPIREHALSFFNKGSHVKLPAMWDPNDPITLEAWVRPQEEIVHNFIVTSRGLSLKIQDQYAVGIGAADNGSLVAAHSKNKLVINRRTHMATSWNGSEIRVFVDGKLAASRELTRTQDIAPAEFTIGGITHSNFAGMIDEVRISKTARYTDDFTPQDPFENDEETVALYHFDEGRGEKTLKDSSGNGHHGEIIGAKWVDASWRGWPVDAPAPAKAPFDSQSAQHHQHAWADYLGVPVEFENQLGMKFRLIPPGSFVMGATQAEIDEVVASEESNDEVWMQFHRSAGPRHEVILTQPFYMGVFEVTQSQYKEVTGQNPSYNSDSSPTDSPEKQRNRFFKGKNSDNYPVDWVTWSDAVHFCVELSQQDGLAPCYVSDSDTWKLVDGSGYRLPSSAQWEFACRAGTDSRYWFGNSEEDLAENAWYWKNAGWGSHEVGTKQANPFGLYDVHGNMLEWCYDWWHPDDYARFAESPAVDPLGPTSSPEQKRLIRGGNWQEGNPDRCTSASRVMFKESYQYWNTGLRVVVSVDAVKQMRTHQR